MELKTLESQVRVVAEARRVAQGMVDKKKSLYDEFQMKHYEFFGDVVSAATVVSEAETTLRELTLKAYAETGNKSPAVGVGIREVTRLAYDAKEAFDWAVGHTMALKLDVSAFEKIVKASPLGFVTISQESQATIATNLES